MGAISIWHWLIVLLIIVLVFGTKKLRNIGSDLGGAVRGFKEGLKESEGTTTDTAATPPPKVTVKDDSVIEGIAREKIADGADK